GVTEREAFADLHGPVVITVVCCVRGADSTIDNFGRQRLETRQQVLAVTTAAIRGLALE
ncbi:unnamed protein product, partial [Phaeothamnion confervicola]